MTTLIILFVVLLIATFGILVLIDDSKIHQNQEAIMDKAPYKFERVTIRKSTYFDNHIDVQNLSGRSIAIITEGEEDINWVRVNKEFNVELSIIVAVEVAYIQLNFKRLWKQLSE